MASEKQPEIGIRNPFQARYGITIPGCKGWRQDQDRSTLRPEELYSAINVRVIDGVVVCRPGEGPAVNAGHATQGCIQGLIDINGGGPRFVLATSRGDTIANAADIDVFDRGLSPAFQQVTAPANQRVQQPPLQGNAENSATIDESRPRYAYCWWNDQIIFGGLDQKLYRFIFPDESLSVDDIQVDPLFDLAIGGSTFDIASMCVMADTTPSGASVASNPKLGPPLYFGSVGGGVHCYVNGELKTLLADGTFTSRVIVFRFADRLYACGTQDLRVQNGWASNGDPATTSFSAVALPVGVTNFVPACAIEFSRFGYIGGQDTAAAAPKGRILRIDNFGATPNVTVGEDGTGSGFGTIAVDDFAPGLGSLYASARIKPTVTEAGIVTTVQESGVLVAPSTVPGNWSEDGMVPRILGLLDGIYISAWATGSDPVGSPIRNGLYLWDGTTLTKLTDVNIPDGTQLAPFDMVAF